SSRPRAGNQAASERGLVRASRRPLCGLLSLARDSCFVLDQLALRQYIVNMAHQDGSRLAPTGRQNSLIKFEKFPVLRELRPWMAMKCSLVLQDDVLSQCDLNLDHPEERPQDASRRTQMPR